MTAFDRVSLATINLAAVDAIVAQARTERSEAVAALLIQFGGLLGRLAARMRPSRGSLPQTGVWA
jgi:hypothetical protein